MMKRRSTRSGFTLFEVVISLSLLGLVLGSAAMVSRTAGSAERTSAANHRLEQNLHRALERAADEIAATGVDHLTPDPIEGLAYDDLEYQPVIGFTGVTPDLGPACQLLVRIEGGEVQDGNDNDGDGLVDERDLILVQDVGGADEREVVLCHGVLEYLEGETFDGADENGNDLEDEPGFHIERNGEVITLRLSLGGQGLNGQVLIRTAELDVRMRN
ncbi:MAG: prepilin-type N-terminal cleavage/methylation domain-containing protein [Chlamydiales bacterium]|jgi:prepilin-type N-terminal cleavage/methylation domain-containing protein